MDEFILKFVTAVVNPILRMAMVGALVVFLYGMFNFIRKADQAEARTTGQQHMLWGLVGLAVIVSVFSILRIIIGTIGAETPNVIKF